MSGDEVQADRRVVGRWLATPDDPFYVTPPTPAEAARVASDAALLTKAADPNRLLVAAGNPERWLPELSALLADLAREAEAVGPNSWAVALARKIMGEQR